MAEHRVRPFGDIKIAMLLNGAHMPFDFFELLWLFFFVAITLLLDAPLPIERWRITNERRMNQLGQQECSSARL